MIVRHAGAARLRRVLSGLTMAGTLLLALAALAPAARAAAGSPNDNTVSLDIVQPAARGGVAEGPVGANVVVQGTATPGDAIQLGIADRSATCQTGFQQVNGATATAQSTGSFTIAFSWPQIANTVNSRYYACAKDTTNSSSPIGASATLFQVDSSDAPVLTSVVAVNDPNASAPGPGTPTPGPLHAPDGTLYLGGFVEIKGANFTPGGSQIQAMLSPTPLTPSTALNPPLPIVKGATVTRSDGTFDIVAKLPAQQEGTLFISVTSSDGTQQSLPTLVASQQVQIVAAPVATAAPTPSPTVSPTPSTKAGGSSSQEKTSSGPGAGRIIGAIVLGLFAALSFILGMAMLISASGMEGEGGPGSPSNPNSAPGRPLPRY